MTAMATAGPLRNHRGFTLVEVVILLVIAAIALPGLMIFFIESMQHSADAQVETVALGLAQELMEEVKAKRWDERSPIPNGSPLVYDTSGGNYSPIGAEGVEARCDPTGCEAFDDMDDYDYPDAAASTAPTDAHGVPLAAYASYRQRIDLCYVAQVNPDVANEPAGDCIAGGAPPTDYKKITVTVTWPPDGRLQLEAVTANYRVTPL